MEHIDELHWIKARASGGASGNCVELAKDASNVHVRDTKSRERGMLTVDAATWRAFMADLKTRELVARFHRAGHPS
jgi:hypothetical protein